MSNTTSYSVNLGIDGGFKISNRWDSVPSTTSIFPEFLTLTLGSGDTSISVSSPTASIIIPPVGNTVSLTLKGSPGDTGVPISKIYPTLVEGSFYLYTSDSVTMKFIFL
jgi:hypothetical protein